MDIPDEPSGHGSASQDNSPGKEIVASDHNATTPTASGSPSAESQGNSSPLSSAADRNAAGISPSPSDGIIRSLAWASASVKLDGKPILTEDSTVTDKPETKTKSQQEMEDAVFNVLEKFMAPREPRQDKDAWSKLADEVWTYENVRVKRWRNEINTLLVFAGLFSAVLTAFVNQYYAVLAPPPDYNTAILERMLSLQLGSTTTDSVVAVTAASGSAALADSSLTGIPSPPAAPRWIAILWFVSLVLSLGAASVALAVNQWLNFHAEQAGLRSPAEKLWTWQLRRDALNKWKVEFIVSLLPCLLQVALVLFLIGIVGYLRVLGTDIAVPSAVFIATLLFFLAATSLLPALVTYSPYKSPQAWWICQATRRLFWLSCGLVFYLMTIRQQVFFHFKYGYPLGFSKWRQDLERRVKGHLQGVVNGARRLRRQYFAFRRRYRRFRMNPNNWNIRQTRFQRLLEVSDWLGQEQLCLLGPTADQSEGRLFADIYSIALDTDVLRAMEVCLLRMPAQLAIHSVVQVGEARCKAFSSREHLKLRGYTLSDDSSQYDSLDESLTTLIGRMMLDTSFRADGGRYHFFGLPSNHRVLAGIIRAMPFADGMEMCRSLYQDLDAERYTAQGSVKFRRAILDIIQRVYLNVDSFTEFPDLHDPEDHRRGITQQLTPQYDLEDQDTGISISQKARKYAHCARYGALLYMCNLQDWERVKHTFDIIYAGGDTASIIQIVTVILCVCRYSKRNDWATPAIQSTETELDDMLGRFERHLASLSRTEMGRAVGQLSPEAIYRLDWTFQNTCSSSERGVWTIGWINRRSFQDKMNSVLRRLQWLLKCNTWVPQRTVPGFFISLDQYVGDQVGWIPCNEDDPPDASQQAAATSGPPRGEDAQQRISGPGTHAPERRFIPRVVRRAWQGLKCSAGRERATSDVESGSNEMSTISLPTNVSNPNDDTAGAGDPSASSTTVSEAFSLPPLVTEQRPPINSDSRPDVHDSGITCGSVEAGADAGRDGCNGGTSRNGPPGPDTDQDGDCHDAETSAVGPTEAQAGHGDDRNEDANANTPVRAEACRSQDGGNLDEDGDENRSPEGGTDCGRRTGTSASTAFRRS